MRDRRDSPYEIPILFEDNHVLVVEKPVNLLSQADQTGDPDMLTLLKQDLKRRYNKPGNVYLGLVHRLDRPVGGVMVFAKTSKAASRLSDAIRTHSFQKVYMAILRGQPGRQEDRLVHRLRKDAAANRVSVVSRNDPQGKEAVLDYRVIASADGLSLVEIQLHTGRPHQIRVQFAEIGCPLYGDQRYGSLVNEPGQQMALWATHLTFPHPILKEPMSFTSSPPNQIPWKGLLP
ncbi:RNA pseudouridine synthase [Xylanibacillus composti]|uniref:RNA pseudouridylate synthase n=2 Tax=Xylanibacillus composti TaxID=1572762 RepID=A0A8J4H1D2_9BACL|nr:RluA family pseudouridine synthase [Xylanibacillus composti]GIQ67632.1 RNA pseudouridine synthase [Xylanibacillus composti]